MVRHTDGGCYHAPEIEPVIEPDGIGDDICWDIGDVCMY